MEKLEDIGKLEAWLVSYMKGIDTGDATNLKGFDEPETEELDSLLLAVEKPMRFKIIFSTRGTEDLTALHYAVKWSHQDVCHTLLTHLSREDKIRILWATPAVYTHSLPKSVGKILAAMHKCMAFIQNHPYWSFIGYMSISMVLAIIAGVKQTRSASNKQQIGAVADNVVFAMIIHLFITFFLIYLEQRQCFGISWTAKRFACADVSQKCVQEPLEFVKYVNKEQSDNVVSFKFMVIRKNLSVIFYALGKQDILKSIFDEVGKQDHKELLDYPRIGRIPFGFGKLTRLKDVLDAYDTYMCSLHNTLKEAIPTPVVDNVHLEEQQQAYLFYNIHDRTGADEEATKMHESLQFIGFTSKRVEWDFVTTLPHTIHETLSTIPRDAVSVVMVCIMSHGKLGTLSDSVGSQIPVNYILHQLTDILPQEATLVVVIQACQDFSEMPVLNSENTDMAKLVAPPTTEDKHIVLTRPNTVLLMATIAGGSAVRGAYTGALAKQLIKANGRISIRQMHTKAVKEVRRLGYHQTPELRETLDKELVLPGRKRSQ